MQKKQVLSLGQCAADHAAIRGMLHDEFGAEVIAAHTSEDALAKLRQGEFALVLVNRILDSDGQPGLDFIDQLKEDEMLRALPVMLVSNYADAQEEATARGALPGFGKSALWQPVTAARLRAVLDG
jgi:CheY-like chemotaxis protein